VQSDYGIRVSFQHNQSELRPPQAWLDFSPQRFPLEPNQSQAVSITLTIPTNAEPGDYFAFLEAHPIIEREGVSIGVAAATKLSFSVRPANAFQAWVVRISHMIEDTQPWSSLIAIAALGYLGVSFLSRYIRIGLRLERRR
jgi:hypothetical protein